MRRSTASSFHRTGAVFGNPELGRGPFPRQAPDRRCRGPTAPRRLMTEIMLHAVASATVGMELCSVCDSRTFKVAGADPPAPDRAGDGGGARSICVSARVGRGAAHRASAPRSMYSVTTTRTPDGQLLPAFIHVRPDLAQGRIAAAPDLSGAAPAAPRERTAQFAATGRRLLR